jgi:hypothetical protein
LVGVRDAIALGPAPPRPVGGIYGDSVVNLLGARLQWKQHRGGGNNDGPKE